MNTLLVNTFSISFLAFLLFSFSGCESSHHFKITNSSKTPVFIVNNSNTRCLALSPDNLTVYAGQADGKVIGYNISQPATTPLVINCNGTPTHIAVHPNGVIIGIAASDGNIELWDIKENKRLLFLAGLPMHMNCFRFSPTGSMIMAAYGDTIVYTKEGTAQLGLNPIIVWDAGNGRLIRRFDGHGVIVGEAVFSADSNFIISAAGEYSKSDFLQWDINTGEIVRKFTGEAGGFDGISISQDNTFVTAFVCNGGVVQWNIQTPDKPTKIFDMKTYSSRAFKCSLDGGIAVIGTGYLLVPTSTEPPLFTIPMDNYVKIFDIRGKKKLASLPHRQSVGVIALSSDGRTLASYTGKDGIRVWKLDLY